MSTQQKSLALHIKSAGDPSAEQMSAIQRFTLREFPAEKLYVRTFVIAHNAVDRDRECFDEALLADFARTLPGKGLHIRHPSGWDGDTGPAKGRWFGAQLQRMSFDDARALLREPALKWPPGATDAVLLVADAFMVRTAGNADLLDELDGGIAGDVSIGFNAKNRERLVDPDGHELNEWQWKGPGEALESSLVWLGAQPGARAIKSAHRSHGDTDVNVEQKLAAAESKNTELAQQLAEAQPSHAIVLGLRKALGDRAQLVETPEALAETVKAADAYRATLVDEIIAGERKAGLLGDDDEEIAAAKAIYNGDPLARLEARAKRCRDQVPAAKVRGTNPNQPDAAPTASKGALADNPAFA